MLVSEHTVDASEVPGPTVNFLSTIHIGSARFPDLNQRFHYVGQLDELRLQTLPAGNWKNYRTFMNQNVPVNNGNLVLYLPFDSEDMQDHSLQKLPVNKYIASNQIDGKFRFTEYPRFES
jgi:hypothetical protein